jgi:predicted acetyltransferase
MPDIEVTPAPPGARAAIQNLFQLYVHDFSEQWAGTARGELDAQGRFGDYPLDSYWQDPRHVPLLIKAGGFLAGFALLNGHGHSGVALDRNMAEFFVVRKHRRSGVGKFAAHAIFSRYPGQWEAAVARANPAALAFWRTAVRSHERAEELEEIDSQGEEWNGPILRFRIRPSSF